MNKTKFVSLETYNQPLYLDVAATSPTDRRVADLVMRLMVEEFGNAGSRTHVYGANALSEVNKARERLARTLDATTDEVIFTSGATESDNLAILGLAPHGRRSNKRHIVSTAIEHKAVLEPLAHLAQNGFEITLIRPNQGGAVSSESILAAVRPDTLLVSVMHGNNETGALQPIEEIADGLPTNGPFFHVDAAQTYGKETAALRHRRIDLISISGHKVMGPKGVGALITRKRPEGRLPLEPLMFGGGQERSLRPGTLATPLIAGFGLACKLAHVEEDCRLAACRKIRQDAIDALAPLGAIIHGDPNRSLQNIVSFAVPGIDSEAAMVALKELIAISNGSACTSSRYEPSHVLLAMGLEPDIVAGTIRVSWAHDVPPIPWNDVAARLDDLRF